MVDFRMPSPRELEILELLVRGSKMYGMEFVAKIALPRGTIYVTLRRMVTKGYLTSMVDAKGRLPGVPRRYYEITPRGKAVYAATLAAQYILEDHG